jgi:hypothetical protein
MFNYGKKHDDQKPEAPPQLYRDIEVRAAGGLGSPTATGKTGADSPVII